MGLRLFHKIIVPGELSEVQLASDRTSGANTDRHQGLETRLYPGSLGDWAADFRFSPPTLNFQPAAKLVIPG